MHRCTRYTIVPACRCSTLRRWVGGWVCAYLEVPLPHQVQWQRVRCGAHWVDHGDGDGGGSTGAARLRHCSRQAGRQAGGERGSGGRMLTSAHTRAAQQARFRMGGHSKPDSPQPIHHACVHHQGMQTSTHRVLGAAGRQHCGPSTGHTASLLPSYVNVVPTSKINKQLGSVEVTAALPSPHQCHVLHVVLPQGAPAPAPARPPATSLAHSCSCTQPALGTLWIRPCPHLQTPPQGRAPWPWGSAACWPPPWGRQ